MTKKPKIEKLQIAIDNREVMPPKRDIAREKIRMILITGILSLLLIGVIFYTLPKTILSFNGLVVYASIVALVIFLFVLLFRYFSILVMAYLYITK